MSGLKLKSLIAAGLVLGASFWGAPAQARVEVRDTQIKGGHETKMCEWATTTWIRSCTATLIHPRVVIYAAHCGSKVSNIFFGEKDKSPGSIEREVEFCKTNPEYKGNNSLGKGLDYAFCLLKEPMDKMPVAPIGYGCELEQVNPENPVWLAGFGVNDNKEGKPTYGVKRMVKTIIGRKSDDGTEIELGKLGFVSSRGDSGGPAYIKLTDGTWRTIGITSWGAGPGPDWYVSAAHAVPWIHKTLKAEGYDDIDITPCYDDDGTWAPSKDCGGFPTDIGTAYGTYKEQCSVAAPLSGPSSICGKPNPDAKKGNQVQPSLEIQSPKDQSKLKVGQSLEVKVEATKAPKGKTLEVTLLHNDKALKRVSKAPYRWTLEDLEAGTHTLRAKGEIEDMGLEFESGKVTFEVVASGDEGSSDEGNSGSGSKGPDSSKGDDDPQGSNNESADSKSQAPGPGADDPEKGCMIGDAKGGAMWLLLAGLLLRRREIL